MPQYGQICSNRLDILPEDRHIRPNMSILEEITNDMKTAMRAKDKVALTTIRALKTAITNAEKGGSSDVGEAEVIGIIRKLVKQRLDSIEQFEAAGRSELAEIEKSEIKVLEKYLPQALSEEEVHSIIAGVIEELEASSMADMGKVMKAVQAKCEGRADGKTISTAVRAALSK